MSDIEKIDFIKNLLKKKILFLDGAMGTMIQRYSLSEEDFRGDRFKNHNSNLKGNNDILVLTQKNIIQKIHEEYLEAGSDIIETCTFNSNNFSQSDYNCESLVYEINYEAACIARSAVDKYNLINPEKPRFVAGSIGPTNQSSSISPDVSNPRFRRYYFDDFVDAYLEQIRGLSDGGADILLIETIFDTLNSKAAIFAAYKYFDESGRQLPIMISGTITDKSGRTLSGQTIEAFYTSISHTPNLLSVGLNCALGSEDMEPYISSLSNIADCFVCLYPNAGLPDAFGCYTENPEFMADILNNYANSGFINIAGGCCGTTPEHIKSLVNTLSDSSPRVIPKIEQRLKLSGLEYFELRPDMNFVNIGERTSVAGSRKFARLIREEKYQEAAIIARQQVENGAQIIDINMDDGMLDSPVVLTEFLNLISGEPDISKVPIMLDSSDWKTLEAGLKCIQGKGIVNSISLKDGESKFLERAKQCKHYGAAMLIMAFDETGQATDFLKRTKVLKRAYDLLINKIGINPSDIIFDPNILTVATGIEEHNNYALDYFETIKWIKANLPKVNTSGGISNVSFSFRGNSVVRRAMHSAFLYHAVQAGLDMGIVNPEELDVYEEIPNELLINVEDVLLNRSPNAGELLVEKAQEYNNQTESEIRIEEWRNLSLEERMKHALIKGLEEYVEVDSKEAMLKYNDTLYIIEHILMDAMKIIGDLFGSGKMFLPQVVKSARVMKKFISYLEPFLKTSDDNSASKKAGRVLLATVRGDVHDIGKNIVGVVLSCNNYDVIDLGVMVSYEKIISEAKKIEADIIGLSGLITPSLEEMSIVATELEKQKLNIPLLIGGATTSRLHTAVKIAPNYSAPVIHCLDASRSVGVVSNLLNSETKNNFIENTKLEYENLKNKHEESQRVSNLLSLSESRARKFNFNKEEAKIKKPEKLGQTLFLDFPLEKLREYINWSEFFITWELKGKFPKILDHPKFGEEARKLYSEANILLDEIISNKLISANGAVGLYPANSIGDDIELFDSNSNRIITTIPMLRKQRLDSSNSNNFCFSLSDFIAPKELGIEDYIGLFAVSAGFGVEELSEEYKSNGDDFKSIMIKVLADRLAEAFAEFLHEKVRLELWAYETNYNTDDSQKLEKLFTNNYRGIRPAPGYPPCPDHFLKKIIFDILDIENSLGISLTETYMMKPAASVCGFYFAHPQANYFPVGKINKDQILDYSRRCSISLEETERRLATILNYK